MGTYGCIVADPPWPSMHQRSTYQPGEVIPPEPVLAIQGALW